MPAQQQAIAATLHSLLPAFTRPSFPEQLVASAQSLAAHSRSRAPTLRADEEVAREYACCHLACERLKQKLNLPSIVARPPCGPRIYKRLYAFLDNALPIGVPTTPQKKTSRHDALASTPARTPKYTIPSSAASQNAETPTRTNSESQAATPTPARYSNATSSATPSNKRRRLDEGGDVLASLRKRSNAPDWLHGATQYLSKKFDYPPASSHIYEGVCEASKGRRLSEEELASLVVAVLLIVLRRLGKLEAIEDSYTTGVREMVALKRVAITRMGMVITDVERWIDEESENWTSLPWFEAVPENAASHAIEPSLLAAEHQPVQLVPQVIVNSPNAVMAHATARRAPLRQATSAPQRNAQSVSADAARSGFEQDGDESEMLDPEFEQPPVVDESIAPPKQKKAQRGTTRGGLGTMAQSANDWLSVERRADYAQWKTRIIAEIDEAERRQQASVA